ncbi:MAG TPA: hypothetical protein VLD85_14865, partial [Anaeromyxobacteraceae bacterium]|nr:hypothetical protein [Anaeromyxobacteraceae bacterium]
MRGARSLSRSTGAALALVALVAACRARPRERVLVLDDGVKMSADGRILSLASLDGYLASNPAWDGRAIALAGARGETVAFQVMV